LAVEAGEAGEEGRVALPAHAQRATQKGAERHRGDRIVKDRVRERQKRRGSQRVMVRHRVLLITGSLPGRFHGAGARAAEPAPGAGPGTGGGEPRWIGRRPGRPRGRLPPPRRMAAKRYGRSVPSSRPTTSQRSIAQAESWVASSPQSGSSLTTSPAARW